MTSKNYLVAVLAIVFLLTANFTYSLYSDFSRRIDQQNAETEELIQWKKTYVSMEPVIKQWRHSFTRIDEIKDLSEVYSVIGFSNYGLEVDPDTLNVASVGRLEGNFSSLDLYNLCLRSSSSELRVTSANINELFSGIRDLTAQDSINIQNIRLVTESDQAVLYIDNFCILLRVPDAGESTNV